MAVCRAIASTALCAFNYVTTVACTQYINTNTQTLIAEVVTGFHVLNQGLNGASSEVLSYASANDAAGLSASYVAWYNWANSFGVSMKLCGYEGGYSPDYNQPSMLINACSYIANATQANPCVLTMGMTTNNGNGLIIGQSFDVGMPLLLPVGTMPLPAWRNCSIVRLM